MKDTTIPKTTQFYCIWLYLTIFMLEFMPHSPSYPYMYKLHSQKAWKKFPLTSNLPALTGMTCAEMVRSRPRVSLHSAINHRPTRQEESWLEYHKGILCMRPANEWWCCIVTLSLIDWADTQNDPSATRKFHRECFNPGVGVTKPNSSIPLFSEFCSIVKTHVSYCISRLYLAGVAAAQLRGNLSNMNVIRRISHVLLPYQKFCLRGN